MEGTSWSEGAGDSRSQPFNFDFFPLGNGDSSG